MWGCNIQQYGGQNYSQKDSLAKKKKNLGLISKRDGGWMLLKVSFVEETYDMVKNTKRL